MMTVTLTGLQITVEVLWYFTDNLQIYLPSKITFSDESIFLTVLPLIEEN